MPKDEILGFSEMEPVEENLGVMSEKFRFYQNHRPLATCPPTHQLTIISSP